MLRKIEGHFLVFRFFLSKLGVNQRPNTPLMSLNVMPCTHPSAILLSVQSRGTLARLFGGSGTESLSNFGLIRRFFPAAASLSLTKQRRSLPRAPAARPGPRRRPGRDCGFPIVSYLRFRERLLTSNALTVPSMENTGVAEPGH